MNVHAGTGSHQFQDNAFEAGQLAARKAMQALRNDEPSLVLVFCTPRFNLPELLAGVRSVTGSALLIGSTSSGEIVKGQYLGFGAGVGVTVMTSGDYRFGSASSESVKGNLDTVGQSLARTSRDMAGPSRNGAIMLLVDCLAGDLQELIRGVYRITGPKISIAGGAAGDDLKFAATFVFHNDKIIQGGAVALWVASENPIPVITRHGWEPIGFPMLVTRAEGTEIIELGGKPAAIAYEEQLGFKPGELSIQDFWSTSIVHPFGLLQSDGTSVIRVARSKTEKNSLMIQGCVPPTGSAVQVMSSSPNALINITKEVVHAGLESNSRAGLILAFSCAARAVILKERAAEEAIELQHAAGNIPTFGVYCCGEFARTAGALGTHNATLTALIL